MTDWLLAAKRLMGAGLMVSSSALLVAAPLYAAPVVADGQTNLLEDGGFEKGTVQLANCDRIQGRLPLNWSDNTCWHNQAVVRYDVDGVLARKGRSIHVELRRGMFQLVQPVRIQPDWHLTAGVWVRSSTAMLLKVGLRQSGAPYTDYGSRVIRTTDQWTWVSVSAFSHGLSEPDARNALFIVSSATPGDVWLDDASLAAQGSDLALPQVAVPAQYFGTHVHHPMNMRTVFGDSHAGSIRVWDAERAQWASIQSKRPSSGKARYNWESLDDRVDAADRRHADVLMVLGGYAPSWASTDVDDEDDEWRRNNDCWRCDETPKRMGDWQKWTTDVTKRYAGRAIKYWEIWNEPYFMKNHEWCPSQDSCASGLGSGYKGSPEQLLQLQVEARKIIKKLDPGAAIVSAGISHHHRDYLDYFLRIGGGQTADVIGYHMYLEGYPELAMPHILALRGILKDHGVGDKPLWCTEAGISEISVDVDPAVRSVRSAGLTAPGVGELAPSYMSRFLIVSWAAGFGRMYQYSWDTQHRWPGAPAQIAKGTNTVVDVNDVGVAYRQTSDWMVGKRLVALDRGTDAGIWKATLQSQDGKRSYIAWHPGKVAGAPAILKRPNDVKTICDLAGRCRDLGSESTIPVDFRPVRVD